MAGVHVNTTFNAGGAGIPARAPGIGRALTEAEATW